MVVTALRRLFGPDFHAGDTTLVAQQRHIFLKFDPGVIIAVWRRWP